MVRGELRTALTARPLSVPTLPARRSGQLAVYRGNASPSLSASTAAVGRCYPVRSSAYPQPSLAHGIRGRGSIQAGPFPTPQASGRRAGKEDPGQLLWGRMWRSAAQISSLFLVHIPSSQALAKASRQGCVEGSGPANAREWEGVGQRASGLVGPGTSRCPSNCHSECDTVCMRCPLSLRTSAPSQSTANKHELDL